MGIHYSNNCYLEEEEEEEEEDEILAVLWMKPSVTKHTHESFEFPFCSGLFVVRIDVPLYAPPSRLTTTMLTLSFTVTTLRLYEAIERPHHFPPSFISYPSTPSQPTTRHSPPLGYSNVTHTEREREPHFFILAALARFN